MKEILLEIINEAKNGEVIIDNENWPICFNTIIVSKDKYEYFIENEDYPILYINNIEELLKILEEYLDLEKELNRKLPTIVYDKERNKIKFLISYLFVNATTEEFLNPLELIKRKINFLKDKTFNNLNLEIELPNLKSNIIVKNTKESIMMETPNKIEIEFTNGIDKYKLPSISYGIKDNECYIYSILNSKRKEENSYHKKIKRLLYKINDGVEESNLVVSPSAVLSLSIFLKLLKNNNIKKVKGVNFLPLRYLSREKMANGNEELAIRNDEIQTNITDKFTNTFNRVKEQTKLINIDSYSYEFDENISIELQEKEETNNILLNEIISKIKK